MEKLIKVRIEQDPETGDLIMVFPPGFVEAQGWKDGDSLILESDDQNSTILKTVDRAHQIVPRE